MGSFEHELLIFLKVFLLFFLVVADWNLVDRGPKQLLGVKFVFGAVHLVVSLTDVLEYLEVIKDSVVVVLQIVLDSLPDRLVQAIIIVEPSIEGDAALHRHLVSLDADLGSRSLEAASELDKWLGLVLSSIEFGWGREVLPRSVHFQRALAAVLDFHYDLTVLFEDLSEAKVNTLAHGLRLLVVAVAATGGHLEPRRLVLGVAERARLERQHL